MIRTALFTLLLVAGCSATGCSAPTPEAADTLYTNATVWTGNGTPATAFAVAGDEFVWVGEADAADAWRGPDTEIVDLGGAFVAPGFIDNHTHFLTGGFNLASVQLRDADSPEEFARRIGEFAATQPAGRWILGGDWDHEAWGGELPDRAWIDELTPDNPVFVSRLDGHMALANTVALDEAGITAETEAPDGGEIVRRADGSPTGVLKDDAMNPVWAVVPAPSLDERLQMIDRAQQHAVSKGVTQIHDVGSYGGWSDLEAFRAAHAAGDLTLRVYSFVPLSSWERLGEYVAEEGRGDEQLWWGALKGFVDGSLGSTTALFYDPYLDAPETRGILVNDTSAVRGQILDADAAGLHIGVHAIGDLANDWLLDAYAEAAAANDRSDRRWRIEHAQHLTRAAIDRFDDLGVIPSMQPYHAIDDGRWAHKRIGERIATTYPFRSLLDAGARLTFGSDWTVAPIDPLLGIHAAVTRRTIDGANPDGWVPEQKITVEEALTAYTVSNAYAGRSDGFSGRIAQGLKADFVVLSADLRTIDPTTIPDVDVLQTVIGGETVFERE